MKHTILVANRGEIALRVIRAAKELGHKTVAIYSQADADSLHVKEADRAICVGPKSPVDSYLNIIQILSAIDISNATAVHPGYGFLSENINFAKLCERMGVLFIGPRPELIHILGDKLTSKKTMAEAGLPMVPGSPHALQDAEEAKEWAEKIKYPVLLKASAGGGGRGMRIVRSPSEMESSFASVKKEAANAFKNDAIFLEKFIEDPHHVEFQIMADNHGNLICFGDRECSVQRRHQKVLEEAPSPHLNDENRTRMINIVEESLKRVNYNNAGTCEFIMDNDQNFYFLEINTRIQVEHPITECIYGVDLIKLQIQLGLGDKLDMSLKNLKPKGHAIECRINAEDPETFMPTPGLIKDFKKPSRARLDTLAFPGCTITPFYDSMIGKLIVHGNTREEAIRLMNQSLDELVLTGITTNIPLHKKILENESFQKPEYTTKFLKKELGLDA